MGESRILTSLLRPFYRKGRSAVFQLPGALKPQAKVLCIDPGDLSEVLFYVPLLNALRRNYPGLQVDFLLPEQHTSLLIPSGLAKQCIVYKEGQLSPWRPAFASLLKKLGAEGYDMAILMSFQSRPRLELATLASGAPLRLGPSHAESFPAINCELRPSTGDKNYLGDRVGRLAPFLCLDSHPGDTKWPLPVDKVRHISQQLHFHKPNPDQMLIGIDPSVGKSGFAFALDNLEFLVRQLSSQLVCKVVPLGVPRGNSRLAEFDSRLGKVPVGLPRDTLLDSALLLSQCNLFIAGNTDFFHLAVALGVPAVGLFSPRDDSHWEPRNRDKARVLRLAKGEKVDVATLMKAVEGVTNGEASTASKPLAGGGVAASEINHQSGRVDRDHD